MSCKRKPMKKSWYLSIKSQRSSHLIGKYWQTFIFPREVQYESNLIWTIKSMSDYKTKLTSKNVWKTNKFIWLWSCFVYVWSVYFLNMCKREKVHTVIELCTKQRASLKNNVSYEYSGWIGSFLLKKIQWTPAQQRCHSTCFANITNSNIPNMLL